MEYSGDNLRMGRVNNTITGRNDDVLDDARKIAGFPIGQDADIQRLSVKPFYTAYPNLHIQAFVAERGITYHEETDTYRREPYIGDISEGKNDAIYNVISYHTKVPYKAIMKFIEHYTQPGDIILDAFCGTGMTGLASQFLNRNGIMIDLCPFATLIASCMTNPLDHQVFFLTADQILKDIEKQYGWLYETNHKDNEKGIIDFVVWSDIFLCPYCNSEFVYWDLAVNEAQGQVLDEFKCDKCGATLKRRGLKHAFDENGKAKANPVLISYHTIAGKFEKSPDENDLKLIAKIQKTEIPFWYPTNRMPEGDESRRNDKTGITNVNDFYTRRNLWILSAIFHSIDSVNDQRIKAQLLFLFTSQLLNVSKLNRFRRVSFPYNPLSGTLYISANVSEANIIVAYKNKLKKMRKGLSATHYQKPKIIVSTQSATDLSNVPPTSIDYIFTDPPFGSNLWYSELNFLYEVWLKVLTNPQQEAVINCTQRKDLDEYRQLMQRSFGEMFRVLKPNRWITVEFHNSKASVWNAIQEALSKAGFIIAQVAILDKQQGTFKQVTSAGAVKNDLVINAYKPGENFSANFLKKAGFGLEQSFVEQHLRTLPIEPNTERTDRMLYSKMLSYYVQHGYEIAMDAQKFYAMLSKNFEERDGFWFCSDQANTFEVRKKKLGQQKIQSVLFVSDEKSAIQWLYVFLQKEKTYSEIYTEFVKVLLTADEKIPELRALLEENFVSEDGKYRRPEILEKAVIDERREKRLLRDFDTYLGEATIGKLIDCPRKEAVLAGFTLCYREKRFQDILTVARKLPPELIENDIEIFDIIEVAKSKVA